MTCLNFFLILEKYENTHPLTESVLTETDLLRCPSDVYVSNIFQLYTIIS